MNSRCSNSTSQVFRNYGGKGVKVCDEWKSDSDQFVLWSLRQGYRYYPRKTRGEQLSIDRIDPTKDYSPDNCRWVLHRDNCSRTNRPNPDEITERSHKLALMFPKAADFCYGRWRIDWKVARDEYMMGDTDQLVKFLKRIGYTHMTIYHIRKKLGDRMSRSRVGFHWWNDGKRNIFSVKCPEGFQYGRCEIKEEQI